MNKETLHNKSAQLFLKFILHKFHKLDIEKIRHKILWGTFMFSSFFKVMPILAIGLGVGVEAQNAIAQKNGKMPVYQTAPAPQACGLNEGECCLARSCKCAMGGAMEFDFLYWRAENTGFTFAYEQKNSPSNHRQRHPARFKMGSGFPPRRRMEQRFRSLGCLCRLDLV